jgi:hypothetical protein
MKMDTGRKGIILKQIQEGRKGSVSGFTTVKEQMPKARDKVLLLT